MNSRRSLTTGEKAFNKWWLSRFDSDYKTICIFDRKTNKKIKEYTTANSRYTDQEDAESAFWTASKLGTDISLVTVNGKKFKKRNGKAIRI